MKALVELSHDEFLTQFEQKTLDEKFFNHMGHLRLAWLYLNSNDLNKALILTCNGIKAYAESLGANDKFNLTLTQALVKIMSKRMKESKTKSWDNFVLNNNDLIIDSLGVLTQYYHKDTLFSDKAKTTLIAPDIKAI